METQTLLILLMAFLLLLAGAVIFVLAYLFLRARNSAENKLLIWQQTRLEMIRKELVETSQQQALRQLDQWRRAEIDNVRVAMRESVRNEMKVDFEQWKTDFEKSIRKDAASKSQSTLVGKITEHFIPHLPEFLYNPQDARFLGSPIDFIVFDGLSEGALRKIIFIEVKTNAGSLSTRERQIRDVLIEKNIEWISIKRKMDISAEADEKFEI
jgi:predicted Holliday junction resolvase-like endonuclease